jgi:Family of unknown function (DUF6188)
MPPSVIPDTFPTDLLSRFRGSIIEANPAYPEVLQLKVRDAQSGEWWFITQEARWSPTDPDVFLDKTVVSADFDKSSGTLTIGFSDGSNFTVTPDHEGAGDDLEAWELFTPERTVLTYGPRGRWLLGRSDNLC